MVDDVPPSDDGPLPDYEVARLTLLEDEGVNLLRRYRAITDAEVRRSILGVVRAMAANPGRAERR